jgi:hypothetical protein
MSPERKLTYRFLELNYIRRQEVVESLGLTSEFDAALTEHEQHIQQLKRARQFALLPQLWDAVMKAAEDENPGPNPFVTKEDFRVSPEFKKLEAEAAACQKRIDDILKEISERCPLPEGQYWSHNAAGTIGVYLSSSEEN